MNRRTFITSTAATLPNRPVILALALPKTALILAVLSCCARACELQTMHGVPVYGSDVECSALQTFDSSAAPDSTVVIPAGASVTLDHAATCLDVLVRGHLILNGHLSCRTLTVLGTLNINDGARLTIRDLPFAEYDPRQWGVGLLVLGGKLRVNGTDYRQTWATVAAEIHAGDNAITFAAPPHGWRAGDRIVVPDTRQPKSDKLLSEQTEVVEISDVQGNTVYLDYACQFDHLGYRGTGDTASMLFDVGCLSQPIVVESENPNGTRGHCAFLGAAEVEARGLTLTELGRTRTSPLVPGVNEIGRYAWHWHHCAGPLSSGKPWQSFTEHMSIDGSDKWGVSIHWSHFVRLQNVFAFNCAGAGIVTEQNYSYGNLIDSNVVIAKRPGSGKRITNDHGGYSGRNDPAGDFWHDRCGFGLSSAMNIITNNRAYCCKESYGMAGYGTSQLWGQRTRGVNAMSWTDPNALTFPSHMGYVSGQPRRYPFVFDTSGNLAWAGWRGIELWSADTHLDYEHGFDGLTLVHCRNSTDLEDQQETVMRGWRILGDYSSPVPKDGGGQTYALNFKPQYRFGITAIDCEFRGHGAAYNLDNDLHYTRFERCTFDCPVVNWLPSGRVARFGAWEGNWTDCTFSDRVLLFADGAYPKYDLSLHLQPNSDSKALLPVRYFVRPWRDGKDWQVFHYEQHPEWQMSFHPDHPYNPTKRYGDLPVGVNSQRQLIELGTPVFSGIVPVEAERWGHFWAAPLDCCDIVPRLRAKILELEKK